MPASDPATRDQVENAISMAIADLKLYVVERESGWLKWVVGFQLTYFAITIGAMFFIAEHVK